MLYVKFACAYGVHLYLYPEVQKAMMIMKYSNNHPELFVENGSEISYSIGFLQFCLSVYTEFLNVYNLSYQKTVEACMLHLIAFKIITDLSKIYYSSINEHKIKELTRGNL